jgi:O-acetyl-ADP-ribose deacetylase (regulator of RNase III)
MVYNEEETNLFFTNEDYALVHCVSEDCQMDQGIAKEFQKRFKLKSDVRINNKGVGTACIFNYIGEDEVRIIFNLVTKEQYYGKPTYHTLRLSLEDMKNQCLKNNIKKLAMPKIASDLDKLYWGRIKEIIKETFDKTKIEILICYR